MRMKLRQLEEDQRNKIKQNALQLENHRNKIQMAKENACARIKDCVHSFDRDLEKNLIKYEGDRILLNGRGFTKIPLDLYVGQNARNNLSSVIIIDLSSNYLEELPSSGFFYFLQNLRKLILSMNNLRTIQSEDMKELGCLEIFEVSSNMIHSIPCSVGFLKEMRSLNASRNKIVTLPSSIGKISFLCLLDLSYNSIESIPPSIDGLRARLNKIFTKKSSYFRTFPGHFDQKYDFCSRPQSKNHKKS